MLVTANDLSFYMDVKFSEKQKVGVQFILEGLESELEAFLRRPVTVRTFTETFEAPYDSHVSYSPFTAADTPVLYDFPVVLPLRNTPVLSVISLYYMNQSSVYSPPQLKVHNDDYVIARYGLYLRSIPHATNLSVTYEAGLDGDEIKVFKLLILRAAAREAANLHDDNRGIDDLEGRRPPTLPTGFTQDELNSVRWYKRQRI